jgi:hypothetical protein
LRGLPCLVRLGKTLLLRTDLHSAIDDIHFHAVRARGFAYL